MTCRSIEDRALVWQSELPRLGDVCHDVLRGAREHPGCDSESHVQARVEPSRWGEHNNLSLSSSGPAKGCLGSAAAASRAGPPPPLEATLARRGSAQPIPAAATGRM